MNSTALLNAVGEMAANLGELDSDTAELKDQLASFSGEADDSELTALPVDFDPATARQQLDAKLLERHRLSIKLQEADAKYQAVRQQELDKALADCEKRYKTTILAMLKSAVAFARSLETAEEVRYEALQVTGRNALVHIGPSFSHFSLRDRDSFMGHWIREARDAGYVTGREDWLQNVTF